MKISLVLAFRERPKHIDNLIKSIRNTAKNLDEIEIILAMDDDDEEGQKHIERLSSEGLPVMIPYITKRSIHFTKDYMNPIARMASGRWVININDDSIFVTQGWDEIINNRMSKAAQLTGDDFHLGMVSDGMDKPFDKNGFTTFCCWPIVSKQSIDVLGYLFDERFYIWGVDHFISHVYRDLKRRVNIYDVLIDHNSLHTQKRPANNLDTNHKRFCEIDKENHYEYSQKTVDDESAKIRSLIKDCKK